MVFLGLFMVMFAQGGDLPTFSFQKFGGVERMEGKLDFGVRLGDRLEVPEPEPVEEKKKGGIRGFLKNLNAENRRKAAQLEQNKAALNHGFCIVPLEKTPDLHPWMQMFDKLEAGIDSNNRIRLLRAILYGENAATQYIIQNRFKTTMENAGYQTVRSTRDKLVRVSVQYDHGIGSAYLQKHFPSIGSVWIDSADRAINLGYPGHLGEPGGVYIEVFDATPIIQEITPQQQESTTVRTLTSRERIIASQNYAKSVQYHEEPQKTEPQQEEPKTHFEKSMEAATKGDLGAAYLELFKMQGFNEAVTLEAYFEIENGMTYKQMKEQFGDPYTSTSINDTTIYTWRTIVKHDVYRTRVNGVGTNKYDPVYGYLRVTFDDKGIVIGKSQDGLN